VTFDGVVWAVENGAKVGGAVGRVLANAATQNEQGVLMPGDLKASATPTASKSVRVAPGSAVIRNRQAPGESYIGLARTFTDVPIRVTGAARTDMVIARVIDPDFSPWQPSDVSDPVNGPYWEPFVVEGVDPGSEKAADVVDRPYSAVELARISVPASGNITAGMIHSLRKVANPKRDRTVRVWLPTTTLATSPPENNRVWFPLLDEWIYCPEWATRAQIVVSISSLLFDAGAYQGRVRAEFGWNGTAVTSLNTEDAGLDSGPDRNRQTIVIAGDLAVPEEFRGEYHHLRTGTITNGGITGRAVTDDWTTITVDVEFVGAAD